MALSDDGRGRYENEALGGVKLALEGLSLEADGVTVLNRAEQRFLMGILKVCVSYREAMGAVAATRRTLS